MSIFKKLLVILLTVALPPLVFISALDQKAMTALSRELLSDHRDAQVERAESELRQLLEANRRLLSREREAVEFALAGLGKDGAPLPRGNVLHRYDLSANPGPGAGVAVWSLSPTGMPLVSVSTAEGSATGEVSPDGILERIVLSEDWAATTAALLIDAPGRRILARRGADLGLPLEVLLGKPGLETIEVGERAYLLGRAEAGGYGPDLVIALPQEGIVARAAHSEDRAAKRLKRQVAIGGTSVAVFALIAIVLSFIGSRSITKPVRNLTMLARRIADGDLHARARIHTGDELEDLGESFNTMIPKLQDRFKMREALSLAMEVQQHLLPAAPPEIPGFDLAGRSIYCDETGGDYYDFIEFSDLDERSVGIAVGDVTGHGVAAALLMTTARALLRSHAGRPGSLSELMTAINHHLAEDAHAGRFMTLFYGMLDAEARSFRWVSAGHEPAILFAPETDTFHELPGHDIPLGIDGSWKYQEDMRDTWNTGEILCIGTDGIWESRNPEGAMFGKEALQEVIRKYADKSADDICDAVARTVRSFRQDQAQQDDITLVVIKATE